MLGDDLVLPPAIGLVVGLRAGVKVGLHIGVEVGLHELGFGFEVGSVLPVQS